MSALSSVPPQYTVRRSRVKDSDEQASLFLRKAYHLVTNCPSELGGWSEKGDTFLVKDAKLFSEQVIPTVYKHNNFSSFVRQLNFYGFRKIKSDLSSIDNPWWEFRHPKFINGMPHLLSEIKRAVHCVTQTESSVVRETELLKGNIVELREKLSDVDKSLTGLANLVQDFMKATGAPINDATSVLLRDIQKVCGNKRNCDSDGPKGLGPMGTGLGSSGPMRQVQRTVLTPDSLSEKTLVSADERDDRVLDGEYEEGEGEEEGEEGDEDYYKERSDFSGKHTQCKQEREEFLHNHTEADFEKFLSFIAEDEQGRFPSANPPVTGSHSNLIGVNAVETRSCAARSSASQTNESRVCHREGRRDGHDTQNTQSSHNSSQNSSHRERELPDGDNKVRLAVSMRDIPCILASLSASLQSRYLDKISQSTCQYSLPPMPPSIPSIPYIPLAYPSSISSIPSSSAHSQRSLEMTQDEMNQSDIFANRLQHHKMQAKLDGMATVFCPSDSRPIPPSMTLSNIYGAI